jgi:hypothetical protein
MPSRKQRRRREKTFRHEYGFVTYDEEGNEVEVEAAEIRPRKEEKPKPATPATRGKRAGREPPAPSWSRSLRRGGIWGAVMLFVVVFFFRGQSLAGRVAVGLLYAAAFIPLTYVVDRMAYRNYLRRSGKSPGR